MPTARSGDPGGQADGGELQQEAEGSRVQNEARKRAQRKRNEGDVRFNMRFISYP